MTALDPVLFQEISGKNGLVGVATLNSEKSLNSLSQEMIDALTKKLIEWHERSDVACVFLEGAGSKAFCAGGDIVKLYASMKSDNKYAFEFFVSEYSLDYMIHSYKKPLIVWGHGIVMGGGLGLMAGAPLRVVTEASKVAMPEITIGLYPDVGASYFLQNMPGHAGLYLALTGTRLNFEDCLYVGLADYYIPSSKKDELLKKLAHTEWSPDPKRNMERAKTQIHTLSERPAGNGEVEKHQSFINEAMVPAELNSIEKYLVQHQNQDEWVSRGVKTFLSGSPTAAHVIVEQLRRSKGMSVKACFEMELGMSEAFAQGHDFIEGIRALLIDKDNKPAWQPQSRSEVGPDLVHKHFRKSEQKLRAHLETP